MSTHRSMSLASLALACLAGCSAQDRTTAPAPTEVPFQAGQLIGATSGRVGTTQTTTGPGVTLTGLTGNFTRLAYHGTGSGTQPAVYYWTFDTVVANYHIWRINLDGTGITPLTTADSGQQNPSISPSGERLVYWQRGQIGGHQDDTFLTELNDDGSHTTLTLDANGNTLPAWAPDEKSVVWGHTVGGFNPDAQLLRYDFTTGVKQPLLTSQSESQSFGEATTGTVDGIPTAIFQATGGYWRMNLNTLDTTFYFASPDPTRSLSSLELSPDGTQIVYMLGADLHLGDVHHPESAPVIYTIPKAGQLIRAGVTWQRDGNGLVFLQPEDTTNFSQLWTMTVAGQLVSQITHEVLGVESGFSVGPAIAAPSSVLIGEDGVLGSTASGIIFGQGAGGKVTAVVAFNSGRPRTVELNAETGLNSTAPVLTYTLKAEQLQTLLFVNDPAGGATTVLDSTTAAAGGAVITFDAATGAVALILPFSANSVAPSIVDQGGIRIFRGEFLGAWKGGKNLAAGGAGAVELDTRTGRASVKP